MFQIKRWVGLRTAAQAGISSFDPSAGLAPSCVFDTADSRVRADSPAWHRRARRNLTRARLLLALVRARDLWTRHHGSHPLKEEMVNTWVCRGTSSCGYQLNWLSHNPWWTYCKKYETVVPKAKRPRERRAVETDSSSSELAKAKRAAAKLEAACAADPDDAECKELHERKKQRLEQVESERAMSFDLQEKLKAAIGEKRDRKRKQMELVDEKVRKEQEVADGVHREFAELVDQYQQMEPQHRVVVEQFTREQQQTWQANAVYQLLSVWEELRSVQGEIGSDATTAKALEHNLSVSEPFEQRRREQFEAQSKPVEVDGDDDMGDGVGPTPDDIGTVERELREIQKKARKDAPPV